MSIIFHENTSIFHLYNEEISYIMMVLKKTDIWGSFTLEKGFTIREDFSYLCENYCRAMGSYIFEGEKSLSLEHTKLEYGVYGNTDYRQPAVEVLQNNGKAAFLILNTRSFSIVPGKPKLSGLPATYRERRRGGRDFLSH